MSQTLPVLSEEGLTHYLNEVRKFPMLEPEEELELARAWQERQDVEAAHQLVTSHLRLVVKIAMGFRGYGLPVTDLISEGNIGLMHAVKKFDHEKGFRLSTYSMWWIRASIIEYVLRSWSMVKMGTSAAQKKLFFNLRKLKGRLNVLDNRSLTPDEITQVAKELDVPERDVIEMDQRLGTHDASLNARVGEDGEDEWIDFIESEEDNQEIVLSANEEILQKRAMLASAMQKLNEREQNIIRTRKLAEEPLTLEDLSQKYGVSRERIRQIEERALEKLQQSVSEEMATLPAPPAGLLPAS